MTSDHLDPDDPASCKAFGRDLGELLLNALRNAKRSDYADLLRRFDEDPAYRNAFEGMLEALGGVVLEHHERLGLVVAARDAASPLTERLERGETAEDRRMSAVALASVMAMFYTEDILEDPTLKPPPLTVAQVHRRLEGVIDVMRRGAEAAESEDEMEMWRLVSSRMSLERTAARGGFRRGTMAGHLERIFRALRDRGLVREEKVSDGETTYHANMLMHVFVSRRLSHSLYTEVRDAMAASRE